jgi:hypothetical protein
MSVRFGLSSSPVWLSDDVGCELVFYKGDAVAQLQLALLEALNLNDIRAGRSLQRGDRSVEIAMLLLQAQKFRPKLAFFLLRHRRPGRAVTRLAYPGSVCARKPPLDRAADLEAPGAVAASALGNFKSKAAQNDLFANAPNASFAAPSGFQSLQ